MNLKEKAQQLKADIPAVFLALKRKDTPLAAKILAGITVAYALSPIDFIPDFIPVLGYLDDILLLPVLIAVTVKLIPPGSVCRMPPGCGHPLARWQAEEVVLCAPHHLDMAVDSLFHCKGNLAIDAACKTKATRRQLSFILNSQF